MSAGSRLFGSCGLAGESEITILAFEPTDQVLPLGGWLGCPHWACWEDICILALPQLAPPGAACESQPPPPPPGFW